MDQQSIRTDDLDGIRRRVVLPVVNGLLRDGELDEVVLSFDSPDRGWSDHRPEPGSVWVRVTACGEDFVHQLVPSTAAFESVADDPENADWDGTLRADEMAVWLDDSMWDWLVMTSFAWGEDRGSSLVVPPLIPPSANDNHFGGHGPS